MKNKRTQEPVENPEGVIKDRTRNLTKILTKLFNTYVNDKNIAEKCMKAE